MNRRTFDVLIPVLYVVTVLVAILIGHEPGVGGVAVFGALFMLAYYATLRKNIKA